MLLSLVNIDKFKDQFAYIASCLVRTLSETSSDSEPYCPPGGHDPSLNHQGNSLNHHGNGINHQGNDIHHQGSGLNRQGNGISHQSNNMNRKESKHRTNPVTAIHQHMYSSHHWPLGMPSKMPPGYNEPPELNYLPVPQPAPPTTSTPFPQTTSAMSPQMLSPAQIGPTSLNTTMTSAILQENRNELPLLKQKPSNSSFECYLPSCDEDHCYDPDSNNSSCLEGTCKAIKWQPYQVEKWAVLTDSNLIDLPAPKYRVGADKGFNFSALDNAFVNQKKNHFQVTVDIGLAGDPKYVRTQDGVKKIKAFYLHIYGVKFESQSGLVKMEQSQSNRSKKPFQPVRIDMLPDQNKKFTVGRLHFSETTLNNMRRKGRPNLDQRYFMLVVSLKAHDSKNSYVVSSNSSERIIVRASNPGQFDSDVDVLWQKGQTPDGVYHVGRVGINTDNPEEALTVHGNIRLTGHLLQPSDIRTKKDLKELDSKDQLKKVAKMRIYDFNYIKDFAEVVGMPENQLKDTGVIAQEVRTVLPDAIKETGDIRLPDGKTIENLLVVNKDRIFMENVGAVKELCKLTNNLENRLDELEKMNANSSKLKRFDSNKSTVSSKSSCSVSIISSVPKRSSCHHSHKHAEPSCARVSPGDKGWSSNRFKKITIPSLTLIIVFFLIAITVLYIFERQNDSHNHTTQNIVVFNIHRDQTPQPQHGTSYSGNSSAQVMQNTSTLSSMRTISTISTPTISSRTSS